MNRPVRPVALVILTACMIYPGVTLLWQGLYPFVAGEYFNLVGDRGTWVMLGQNLGLPPLVPLLLEAGVGLAWVAGVLGVWAGDGRALPLVALAAAGSLLHPGGSMVMGAIALVCLAFFRESPDDVPA
ncbi:MAG TPA: hypothetical protein VGK89_04515 [Candidatus Eisenbacteria bacterium]|jgi:hypothetical protein